MSLKPSTVVDTTASIADESADEIRADAQAQIDAEQSMSFREAIQLYPMACFWSLFFSLGVIMTAFDPQLLGNLYATPSFRQDFGYLYNGSYIISAAWQTGLSMGNPVGQYLGAFISAWPLEAFGRKRTFGACVILTTLLILIQFFARTLAVLLVGELLGGLVLGTYVVIAPAYASEVCPVPLRGVLTSVTNIAFVAGQLIANGVVAGTSVRDDHWAYSAPFAVQWVWPVVILAGLGWAPESPWWLLRRGRVDEARASLRALVRKERGVDVERLVRVIVETDRLEREMEAGSTYRDCFKKVNWRRTEIACGVYSIQVLSGIYLVNYATYFFELAGLPTDKAFDMGVGFLAIGFVATCFSWVLLSYISRRTIFNTGLALLGILQLIIAIIDCAPNYDSRPGLAWAEAVIMMIWNFVYDLSIGPVCFVILSEVSATRVRSKTIAVATAVQAILGIVFTVAIPYALNADQGNWRGKLGFLFGGMALASLVWSWLRVPETGRRSYEELDIMFERGVKARDFKKYVVMR